MVKKIWEDLYQKCKDLGVKWDEIKDYHPVLYAHLQKEELADFLVKGYLSIEDKKWEPKHYVETISESYRDGKWQGFQGKDVTLTYRWSHDTLISEVEVSYLHHYTDWILAPQDVELYTTVNGKEKLVKKLHVKLNQVGGDRLGSIVLTGLKLRTDNLKVVVRNPGVLPSGHSGAGYPSYIFLDEILIR